MFRPQPINKEVFTILQAIPFETLYRISHQHFSQSFLLPNYTVHIKGSEIGILTLTTLSDTQMQQFKLTLSEIQTLLQA